MDMTKGTGNAPVVDPNSFMPAWQEIDQHRNAGEILLNDSDLHRRLLNIERYEADVQERGRREMLIDQRYYDGLQYTHQELRQLRDRGQAAVVYNWIQNRVNWMTGTERRARVEYEVAPRIDSPEANADAMIKTQLLKYVDDVNNTPYHISAAFKQAVTSGLSWLESGIRPDEDDEPLYDRMEQWWSVLHDSNAQEPNLSDMRYLLRNRRTDVDIAMTMFPAHADRLSRLASNGAGFNDRGDVLGGWYAGRPLSDWHEELAGMSDYSLDSFDASRYARHERPLVDLREAWIYLPVKAKRRQPYGGVTTETKMRLCLAMFDDQTILDAGPTPYRHGKIPFTPIVCYRRFDGTFYGIVRTLRDPQDSFNKRMAKALFAISSTRTILDGDAIDPSQMTADQLRREASRPDAQMIFANGAVRDGKVQITDGRDIAESAIRYAQLDYQYITIGSGVNDDNLGMQTNAQSGIAIERRQAEGSVTTTEPFDNLHLALHGHGIRKVSLLEQYYTRPKAFRLTGNRLGSRNWGKINQINADGTQVENDITRFNAEFVLDQRAWRSSAAESARAELKELLSDLAPVNPQIVMALLDIWIGYGNWPDKDKILARVRAITGMRDESVPETPEEQAARQSKEQLANAQLELTMAEQQAKIRKAQSEGTLARNRAVKEALSSIISALEAAPAIASNATLTPAADTLLDAAGFEDRSKTEPDAVDQTLAPKPPTQPEPATEPPADDPALITSQTPTEPDPAIAPQDAIEPVNGPGN